MRLVGRAVRRRRDGPSSKQFWKRPIRPKMYNPSRARDMATINRRTSRMWPTVLVLTRERRMKSFCWPWKRSTVVTFAGRPKFCLHLILFYLLPIMGLLAHRFSITSLMRCFWPLYVVKMEIFSAGYPTSRMYMKVATMYSASAKFW